MNMLLTAVLILLIPTPPQQDPQEEARRKYLEEEGQNSLERFWQEESRRDLWYGTPGARLGSDMLGPVLEIFRKPSSLLDFRPRRTNGYVPLPQDQVWDRPLVR